jgi:hypothetical protein
MFGSFWTHVSKMQYYSVCSQRTCPQEKVFSTFWRHVSTAQSGRYVLNPCIHRTKNVPNARSHRAKCSVSSMHISNLHCNLKKENIYMLHSIYNWSHESNFPNIIHSVNFLFYVYCPMNVHFYSLLIVKHSPTCFEPYPGSFSGTSVF